MVAIIIVHYQNIDDTLRCVDSLRQSDFKDFKIIIVDSCSPNKTGKELKNKLHDCSLILLEKNLGFAASCNVGIQAATGAKYIWLLNPDTTVRSDALSELLKASERYPEVAAYGSKILYGDHPELVWSAGACINLTAQNLRMIGNKQVDQGQFFTNTDCDYLPGCSIFAKSEIFNSFLPEKYFMYFEETDWCFSLKLEGKKLMYVDSSVVYHHTNDNKMQSAFNVYYYNRNELFFWYKFSTIEKRIKIICNVIFRKLPQALYALSKAPNEEHREIFKAHVFSNLDFLLNKSGKRY